MERNQILLEILSDPDIMEKYSLQRDEIITLTTNAPYNKKIVEVLATIINENDNHLNSTMIYKKIKNIHNIG